MRILRRLLPKSLEILLNVWPILHQPYATIDVHPTIIIDVHKIGCLLKVALPNIPWISLCGATSHINLHEFIVNFVTILDIWKVFASSGPIITLKQKKILLQKQRQMILGFSIQVRLTIFPPIPTLSAMFKTSKGSRKWQWITVMWFQLLKLAPLI